MTGMRFSMAIFCARMTFFAVIGKNAPAFTVASFAMTMNLRPQTVARPVTVPAEVADLLLLIFDLGQQVDDASRVLFEVRRFAIDGRVQSGRRHAASSRQMIAEIKYTVSETFPRAAHMDCSTVSWEARFSDE